MLGKQPETGEPAISGSSFAWDMLDEVEEYRLLCRVRLEHTVRVREPLVLISQIQRSGGSLLSQLFDGHPQCHVYPNEIKIGHPNEWTWPPLDLDRPEQWFEILYHRRAAKDLQRGYRKSPLDAGFDVFPFLFSPRLQKQLFERCRSSHAIGGERDVLDCYFTSYFNAWLDNHNLYTGPKRLVVGFTPRLAMQRENVERFFAAYPEGTLVSTVREPRAWYASARKHKRSYGTPEQGLALWRGSTKAALESVARYGDRVVVLTYEQLVLDTERTMRRLAERIGIEMSPTLLLPTFNGRPIRANSVDAVEEYGILQERVEAYRETLDPETLVRITELAGDLYARAQEVAAT
jgi:hypothetical protein